MIDEDRPPNSVAAVPKREKATRNAGASTPRFQSPDDEHERRAAAAEQDRLLAESRRRFLAGRQGSRQCEPPAPPPPPPCRRAGPRPTPTWFGSAGRRRRGRPAEGLPGPGAAVPGQEHERVRERRLRGDLARVEGRVERARSCACSMARDTPSIDVVAPVTTSRLDGVEEIPVV